MGNLLSLTDPVGSTTAWVYNDLHWLVEETNELEDTRYFSHDLVGNVIEIAGEEGASHGSASRSLADPDGGEEGVTH